MKSNQLRNKREKFFLSVAPHFEKELLQEMREVFPFLLNPAAQAMDRDFPECEIVTGGIQFEEELFIAVQFQFFLKTAHRLLWRVDEFKAKDFPTLFNKTKSSRLKTMLISQSACHLKVAASESRLGQEKRIAETTLEALEKAPLKKTPEDLNFSDSNSAKSLSPAGLEKNVYVRLFQDQVQLSLDLSGPHLHFRNYATNKLAAPLRETWASLFARTMIGDTTLAKLQQIILIDPFAGSGTLLYEAALLMTPNFLRPLAMNSFSQSPALFKLADFHQNYRSPSVKLFKKLIAIDQDTKAVECLQANFSELKQRWPDFPAYQIKREDAISAKISEADGPRWVFSNPPYGDRLQSELNLRNSKNVDGLVKTLAKNYGAERVGLVVPLEGARPLQAKCHFYLEFSNGGIACAFIVFDFFNPPQK